MASPSAPLRSYPPSPLRLAIDQLLEQLVAGLLAALSPMERTFVRAQVSRRGWDLRALSRSGPLSGLRDAELAVLLEALSDRVDRIVVEHADELAGDEQPSERAALEALGRSIARL